jgi:hypothetical protein
LYLASLSQLSKMYFVYQTMAFLAAAGIVSAATINPTPFNNPTAGPPSSLFQATSTINIAALKTAAAAAKQTQAGVQATFPLDQDNPAKATIRKQKFLPLINPRREFVESEMLSPLLRT